MFDVLILAAGKGTRMESLTEQIAKPALKVGGETIIGRLSRQVNNLEGFSRLYVNCSYRAESIIQALQNSALSTSTIFLWEREIMGTAWSLSKVAEKGMMDLLVIHGDLFIDDFGLQNFVSYSRFENDLSTIAIHERNYEQARSVVSVDQESGLVSEVRQHKEGFVSSIHDSREKLVWSNSGIYYFRLNSLIGISSESQKYSKLEDSILPQIIKSRQLKAKIFCGNRYALETPGDLAKIPASMLL